MRKSPIKIPTGYDYQMAQGYLKSQKRKQTVKLRRRLFRKIRHAIGIKIPR